MIKYTDLITTLETTKSLILLVVKSIIPDLCSFNIYELCALMVFAGASIVFSFIDFNYLTDPENNPSIYTVVNDRLYGVEEWRSQLMCVSGAASFTGVLSVVLTTKGKITSFFWGAINSLLFGLFSYAYGYAGDAQLNLFFFLPMQFVGIYCWGKNISDGTVRSQRLSVFQWIGCLAVSVGIAFAFYYEIPVFAESLTGIYYFEGFDFLRQLDSVNNALSIVAQILSIYQFSEQWYWWITVDCIQIAMYSGVAGYGIIINILVMWLLFLLNALAGCYAWHMRYTLINSVNESDIESGKESDSTPKTDLEPGIAIANVSN